MSYYEKYTKYKKKYLNLVGGSKHNGDSLLKKEYSHFTEQYNHEDYKLLDKISKIIEKKRIDKLEKLIDEKKLIFTHYTDNYISVLRKILNEYDFYIMITDKIINFFLDINNIDIDYYLFYEALGDFQEVSYKILSMVLDKGAINVNNYIDLNRNEYRPIINEYFKDLENIKSKLYDDQITPLNAFSKHGSSKHVKILLDHGANPNIEDINNRLPIHRASTAQNYAILELLVPITDNINHVDKRGNTALLRFFLDFESLIISSEVNYNMYERFFSIVDLFFKKGATLFIENDDGHTVLNYSGRLTKKYNYLNIKLYQDITNKIIYILDNEISKTSDHKQLNDILILACNVNSYDLYNKIKQKIPINLNNKLILPSQLEDQILTCFTTENINIINDLLTQKNIDYNLISDAMNDILLNLKSSYDDHEKNNLIQIVETYSRIIGERFVFDEFKHNMNTILNIFNDFRMYENDFLFNLIFINNKVKIEKIILNNNIHEEYNIIYKNIDIFKKLIKNKYDVNMRIQLVFPIKLRIQYGFYDGVVSNCTLLTIACIKNEVELINFLMLNGADKNIRDSVGKLPFDYLKTNILDDEIIPRNLHFEYVNIENDRTNEHLIDPITLSLLDDPYIASDGNTYSKSTLDNIFRQRQILSPITREELQRINGEVGIPNRIVSSIVEKYKYGKLKILLGGTKK